MSTGSALLRGLRRLWRREDGNASIEFAIALPATLMIFMASVEAGYYMIRHVMMERGLDLVMRDYRLGRYPQITHSQLRTLVCNATPILRNCERDLKVWVSPINTTTWSVNTSAFYCGDGNGTLNAQTTGTVLNGGANQPMFVRICTLQNPIFPTTGIGLELRADSRTGGYQLAAATVVVNEPR
ncbi:TadE/TadG family type IV pilus assembly protein [Neotabrizicola sp. VNH66]|uniref:TadE/TadG family type IV pilus assembly protein n=1 Tax=Neotabrizicola sp. VNH66 TaxID=3400918 RepID=UPI003C0432CF